MAGFAPGDAGLCRDPAKGGAADHHTSPPECDHGVDRPHSEWQLSVTDGPFAETKEQIGGFFLIEASDLQEAIKVAAKWPSAAIGSIEVRPIEEELRIAGRYSDLA